LNSLELFDGYKSDLISVGLLNDLARVKQKRIYFFVYNLVHLLPFMDC